MKWICLAKELPPLNTLVLISEFCNMSEKVFVWGEHELHVCSGENSEVILAFQDFYFEDVNNVYWTKDYTYPKID